ncbi:MAG TPA: choice-of-anchor D domain-containing protein [Mycobacteriales bacterium]|nr:choice-of-anchor D domain-containing protein [Mycobacteriales bacterium]
MPATRVTSSTSTRRTFGLATVLAVLLSLVGGFTRPAAAAPVLAADTLQSGAGFAFGRNDFGQVKPGTTANQLGATALPAPGGTLLKDAVSIAAGNGFTIWADHVGRVWSIGDNGSGQSGTDTTGGTTTIPTQALGFGGTGQPKAVKVAAYGLAVDVLDANGDVWQWGQVANNNSTLTVQKTPSKLPFPSGTQRIIDIAAGNQFSLAMDAAYKAYSWGKNDRGQLGTNSTSTSPYPTAVLTGTGRLPSSLTAGQSAFVEAGKDFAIYTVSGPTGVDVYTWGAGNAYQLGNGKTLDAKAPAKMATYPAPSGGSLRALGVSGGGTHALLLTSDRVVRSWGSNGVSVNQTPAVVSSALFSGTHVPYLVAAGDGASFVASTDGTIAAWGSDTTGQLGRTTTGTVSTPTLITIPGTTPPTTTGPPVQIVSRQGATYSIVDAEIASTPDRNGFDFGAFPTSPLSSQTAPAHAFTLTNTSTKALTVTSFGVEGTSAGDFVTSGSPCTSIAVDASCSITITFRPTGTGLRSAALVLRTSNTLGGAPLSYAVPLVGSGYTAVLGLSNFKLDLAPGAATTLPGRGDRIPVRNIDPALIPEAVPAVGSATLGKIPLPTLGKITLGKITLGKITLGKIDPSSATLGKITLGKITLGKIGLPTLGKITLGKITLGKITLGKIPLLSQGGWTEFVKDYPALANVPASSITFDELLAQPATGQVAAPADRLTLDRLDLANSFLSQASFLSILMASTKLSQYPVDWCDELAAFESPAACTGTGLNRSLFDLSVNGGYPIDSFKATGLTLGQLTPAAGSSDRWANAVWPQLSLAAVKGNLVGTHLGAVPLSSIPAANLQQVLNCSAADCTNLAGRTLGDDDVVAAIKDTAGFGDLGAGLNGFKVAWLVEPFLDRSEFPWEQLPRSAIPPSAYPNKVPLRADVDLNCLQAADTHFAFDLPAGYDYVPASATLTRTRGTGRPLPLQATTSGQHVDVAVPDSVFAPTGAIACTNDSGHVQVNIAVLPPDTAASNQKATGSITTGALSASGTQLAGVTTTGVYNTFSTSPDSGTFQSDELVLGHVNPDQVLYTGSNVASNMDYTVTLSQQAPDTNLDLVLYHPVNAALDPVLSGSTAPVPVPFGESAAVGATPGYTPPQASGGALQDVPLRTDRPVAAVSAMSGNQDEQLSTVTRSGDTTRYVSQITGFNGLGGDFMLRARTRSLQNLGPCTVTPPTVTYPTISKPTFYAPIGQSVSGFATGDDTLVLVNGSRLDAYYAGQSQTVLSAAYNFTHSTSGVHGQVKQLDSSSSVNAAYKAWDANPCDPNLSNEVVRQINAFAFAGLPASIKYVVILGGHSIVPHALPFDTTGDGSEKEEAGDIALLGNNPLSSAFALGRYATDTPFGTPRPLLVTGQVVYAPTLAVGRLGETAASIAAQLDRYRTVGGVADAAGAGRTATVTDYDFLSSGGSAVASALGADYAVDHSLTGKTATWSKAQLDAKWLAKNPVPSIGVLNMHYDQYRALPALGNATNDLSDLYTADQVAKAAASLTQRIVLTVGCHSALDVPDGWLPNGTDPSVLLRAQDWAQRYGEKGVAVMIGNLGFGYADTNVVAFSALEQQLLAEAMAKHFDLGTSLVQAQQEYLQRLVSLSPYDIKSLQQMVLWGLPQYRTTSAPAAQPPAWPTAALTTDAVTQLPSYALTVAPEFRTVDDGGTSHLEARSSSTAPWQAASVNGLPVLPLQKVQLPAQTGLTVRSAVPTGLTTGNDSSATVTFGRAGTDEGLPQLASDAGSYPATLGHLWTVPRDGTEASTLAVTPAQIHLDGTAAGRGAVRQVTSSQWLVRYGTPGHAVTPDTFTSVSASHLPASGLSSATTSYQVDVTPAAGAQTSQVYALARPQSGAGAWVRTDLAKVGAHWVGTRAGYLGEYIVVAVNSLGYGAMSTFNGDGWQPGDLSALHLDGNPGNDGWYTSNVTLTADPGYTIWVDGAPVGPSYALGNGQHQLSLQQPDGKMVGSQGQTSYLLVKVDAVVPTVTVTLSNNPPTFPTDNGQPHPNVGSLQPYTISVAYGPSGGGGPITVNGTEVVGGTGTLDTSKVGQRSLVVTAPSAAGLSGTGTKDYRVVYKSAQFVAPVQSTNTVLPLLGYQYTFQMLDDANNQVTTAPAGTAFTNTITSAATCEPPGSINLPASLSGTAAPTYDASNQRWAWTLTRSGITCQSVSFTLNDGWTRISTLVTVLTSS